MVVETAQANVRKPIIVKIADRYPGAVKENPVSLAGSEIEGICKVDSRLVRTQKPETGLAATRHIQFSPPKRIFLMPLRGRGAKAMLQTARHDHEGYQQRSIHFLLWAGNGLAKTGD